MLLVVNSPLAVKDLAILMPQGGLDFIDIFIDCLKKSGRISVHLFLCVLTKNVVFKDGGVL